MIDVHAHFADEGYEFPAEWERIAAAGVHTVVLAADTVPHAEEHARFAREHDGCYFTVGVHPSELSGLNRDAWSRFRELAAERKCIAVGEIGLDYHYPDFDRRAQRTAFEEQLTLACDLSLPVQIHSRDACADTLDILKAGRSLLKKGFLMHCYSYGRENLDSFLSLGAYFSFGGVVCFKNARRAVESVTECPLDRLLTETDSPYLSPFRGEKNSPANLPVIAERLARIKGISREELIDAVRENAERLFERLRN